MRVQLKAEIEQLLQEGSYAKAEQMLSAYRETCPYDRDGRLLAGVCSLLTGDVGAAETMMDSIVRQFPTSYEAYYYQACVYQAQDKTARALRAYKIAEFLITYLKQEQEEMLQDIRIQLDLLEKRYTKEATQYLDAGDAAHTRDIACFMQRMDTLWGKVERAPRDMMRLVVGDEYWITDQDLRYIGIYRDPIPDFVGAENMSLVRTQAEFLPFERGQCYEVQGEVQEYLLPIASAEPGNVNAFLHAGEEYTVVQLAEKHFNYYRVKNETRVLSKNLCYYGNPIPLEHRSDRHRLVLSFFVDGLAQEVINGSDFATLMPNTYAFFKKGTICTETYSCAEWTYPSLPAFWTGLSTFKHMLFHNTIDGELPEDVPTLAEYFKRAGYYTCKMDGEWRSIYSYGYARGVDQYIYQVQPMGARAEQEIINVIEHLEAFKETDQYLWMAVGDLHDIADGLDQSQAVQNFLPVESRAYVESGATSVKQAYNTGKITAYKRTIHYYDMLFGILFRYIEQNYRDEEILISLFADHGQGYLLPPDAHFLSKERSKVAFMFRGAGVPEQITDEVMSTADYLPIMCKLAGLPQDSVEIDGRLPKAFGGTVSREYAITESLHPGDAYTAVANTGCYTIVFENTEPTDEEGRFRLGAYQVYGYDRDGRAVEDAALLGSYETIFLERIREHIIYE